MKFNLKAIKEIINTNTNVTATIEYIYIDFGANWMADTIVITEPKQYQLLSPRDINTLSRDGGLSYEEVERLINKINERGW